jgi:hypothetical protein
MARETLKVAKARIEKSNGFPAIYPAQCAEKLRERFLFA